MRKPIITALIFISAFSYGQSIAMLGAIASSGSGIDYGSNVHPITHDQLFIVPSGAANNDYIGEVHYNCTDSIFNDRSSG